jgi:hypothetical protein
MSNINFCISKKKSGDICNKPGKYHINNKFYCGIHYKKVNKEITNNDSEIIKEDNVIENNEIIKEDNVIENNEIIKEDNVIENNEIIKEDNEIIKEDNDEDEELTYIKQIIEKTVNFKIIRLIKEYNIGDLYSTSNPEYCIKLLYHQKNNSQILKLQRDLLFWEHMILFKHFNNHNNVIKLYDNGDSYYNIKDDKYYITILILYKCEDTLINRFNRFNCKFTDDIIKNYGKQLVKAMKELHSKGYVYINFDMNNFMFKNNDSNDLLCTNFTLCKKYINLQCFHIEQTTQKYNNINNNFSSIYCNSSKTSDRISDIQSIGYILLYLYHNDLPWYNKKNSNNVLKLKKNITDTNLFINSPKYIQDFIIESYNYKYSDKPYYENFITLLY